MALTQDQKQAQIKELTTKMSGASSVIFSHYIGLNVTDVGELRDQLREAGAEMKVAKKTLIKIAAQEAGLPEIDADMIDGPIALIMSSEDPLSGAQIAFKFGKDHDQVGLLGGIFEGAMLTKEQAMEFAKMPGREELLAKLVGMLRSPLTSFAGLCSSPLSGFARGLSQLAEKGGVGGEETEEVKEENQENKEVKESEEIQEEEEKEETADTEEPNSDS